MKKYVQCERTITHNNIEFYTKGKLYEVKISSLGNEFIVMNEGTPVGIVPHLMKKCYEFILPSSWYRLKAMFP